MRMFMQTRISWAKLSQSYKRNNLKGTLLLQFKYEFPSIAFYGKSSEDIRSNHTVGKQTCAGVCPEGDIVYIRITNFFKASCFNLFFGLFKVRQTDVSWTFSPSQIITGLKLRAWTFILHFGELPRCMSKCTREQQRRNGALHTDIWKI